MFEYVSRREWLALPPESVTPQDPASLEGVVVHWWGDPAAPQRHQDCPKVLRGVQRAHLAGEFNDLAYGMLVCQHGVVYEGRGFDVQTGANGNRDANRRYGSVCAMIGEGDKPTSELLRELKMTIGEFRRRGAGLKVIPHGLITGSACPGPHIRIWIAEHGFEGESPAANERRRRTLRDWLLARKREGRSWAWLKRTANFREWRRRGGK